MRITIHARGGFSVYGQGNYDPHRNEAIIPARENETKRLVIDYPSAPTNITVSESGISATTPTTSVNQITTTLSGIQCGGYVDITATYGSETFTTRIRAETNYDRDGYES